MHTVCGICALWTLYDDPLDHATYELLGEQEFEEMPVISSVKIHAAHHIPDCRILLL